MREYKDMIDDIAKIYMARFGQPINPEISKLMVKEGNYEEWTERGFLCRIRRPPNIGAWCGYVRVPKGHPVFGKDYYDIDVDVHGGLTYSAHDFPDSDIIEKEHYWIGFDCAHGGDYTPGMDGMEDYSTYRTKEYVMDQVKYLVTQLKAMK